jgi:hypothetical protein
MTNPRQHDDDEAPDWLVNLHFEVLDSIGRFMDLHRRVWCRPWWKTLFGSVNYPAALQESAALRVRLCAAYSQLDPDHPAAKMGAMANAAMLSQFVLLHFLNNKNEGKGGSWEEYNRLNREYDAHRHALAAYYASIKPSSSQGRPT